VPKLIPYTTINYMKNFLKYHHQCTPGTPGTHHQNIIAALIIYQRMKKRFEITGSKYTHSFCFLLPE